MWLRRNKGSLPRNRRMRRTKPSPISGPRKSCMKRQSLTSTLRFANFNKQKIPYDQKLEAKTKREQKDLAAKYAAVLQTRKSLSDGDSYYLGMLHYLAGNGDGALPAMRRYLSGKASGEDAQLARAVVVLYTTRQGLVPEAERAVAAYAQNQPQNLTEWFGMETLITEALQKEGLRRPAKSFAGDAQSCEAGSR